MMRTVLFAAALVGFATSAAAEGAFQVQFDLANLDGKKGEYGSFTLEVSESPSFHVLT